MASNRKFTRWLLLKPFDEAKEIEQIKQAYDTNNLLATGIIASAVANCAALVMAALGGALGLPAIGLAICFSAVTAGLEWNAGLRARALNQLYAASMCTILFILATWLH